jgi:diguanylate cyclase (GGDEF)-like protein
MLLVPDATQDQRFHDNPFVIDNPNVRFYAGCPIRTANGMPIGTLCAIDTKPREFTPDQLAVLRDLAAMIETEIKVINLSQTQKELIQELDNANRLALIDPLTRLWNRAGILEILNREWHDAQRQCYPVTLIMADIDHFKDVNDTFGHAAGDIVLKEVAKNLLECLRGEDAVGRVGGEEFLIFLKNLSDRDRIAQIIGRLQETLSLNVQIISTLKRPVTMSFGIATTVPQLLREGADSLINEADTALYKAKRAGRNRFEFA